MTFRINEIKFDTGSLQNFKSFSFLSLILEHNGNIKIKCLLLCKHNSYVFKLEEEKNKSSI